VLSAFALASEYRTMEAFQTLIESLLPDVAHTLYADAYVRALAERDIHLHPQTHEGVYVPRADAVAVPLLRELIAAIEAEWGVAMSDVISAMGLSAPFDVERALTDVCLGAIGHGYSFASNYADQQARAEQTLGCDLEPPTTSATYAVADKLFGEAEVAIEDRPASGL
jgi:hypothetical protein